VARELDFSPEKSADVSKSMGVITSDEDSSALLKKKWHTNRFSKPFDVNRPIRSETADSSSASFGAGILAHSSQKRA
jgi:hypothetical protein